MTYNLARMKEVDKDSPEYQTSSEKFRKQTEKGYAYYIIEDIGEEYEESGNSQREGIQIVKFSKQLEKKNLCIRTVRYTMRWLKICMKGLH